MLLDKTKHNFKGQMNTKGKLQLKTVYIFTYYFYCCSNFSSSVYFVLQNYQQHMKVKTFQKPKKENCVCVV